jgi:hypothetical protein
LTSRGQWLSIARLESFPDAILERGVQCVHFG